MKKIKRYANRKLYDTNQSCYVTLEDVGQMIRAGEEIEVVDNKSGEDLTQVTLAQIIFETEKRRSFMPLALLRKLIQGGGDALGELARDSVDRVQATAHQVKNTAWKLRNNLGERMDRKRRRTDDSNVDFAQIFAQARQALAELEARGIDSPSPAASADSQGQPQDPTDAAAPSASGDISAQPVAELRRRLAQLEGLLGPCA